MHHFSTLYRLGVLAVALALAGWLSPTHAQRTFDNGCAGNSDWNCAANWNPDGVPGDGDDVFIGSFNVGGTFSASTLASLTLDGTTLNTDGILTVGQLDWSGGLSNINAGATITISGNGSVWSGASKGLNDVTFTISPGVTVTNSGAAIFLQNGTVLQNFGTFDLQNDGSVKYTSGAEPAFVNAGTIRKTTGTSSSEFIPPLINNGGLIVVDQGTLRFERGGTLNGGTYDAEAGAALRFRTGTFTASGTLSGDPAGFIGHESTLTVADGSSATLDFSGAGYQWSGGTITAPGSGVLINTGLLRLTGTSKFLNGSGSGDVVLRNEATVSHEGGGLIVNSGAVLENAGLYDLQNDRSLDYTSGAVSEFVNEAGATFRKSSGSSGSFIDVPFTNEAGATVLANSGRLHFTRTPFLHQVGATLGGDGGSLFPTPTNPFVNNGVIAPGTSPGLLTWQSNLAMSATSRFVTEIGGTTVGDDFDRLVVNGDVSLGGTLEIAIAVGDAPGIGDTYTVLATTAVTDLSGAFDTIEGPFGYTFDVDVDEAADEVTIEVLTVPNFDLAAVNVNPSGSPIVVAKPGSIQFAYAVTNNTNAPITGDVFFSAETGGNTLAQGVILSGTLPANSSSPVLNYTQPVPGFAPTGTYTYTIKIGEFPSTVVDQVAFTVQVVSSARPTGDEQATPEAWAVREATSWLAADGSVVMSAPEQAEGAAVPEAAEAEAASEVAVPEAFGLAAAYPNPFRSQTTFALDVPAAGRVTVAVYDALGRRVAVLLDGEVEAGTHRLGWDAAVLPGGVYLVRAAGAGATAMQRVTLVR